MPWLLQMLRLVVSCLWLAGLLVASSEDELPARVERGVHEPHVVEAAEWALAQLRELSDSGVYRSLSLARVARAATQRGVFHDNTFLELELASPHLRSGAGADSFDVVVMRALDDGVRSLAIDEFPEMTDDAIERFWIEKVERHRSAREEAFAKLELEVRAGRANQRETRGDSRV